MTSLPTHDLNIPFDNSYAHLPDRFFAKVEPTAVTEPSLIALNSALAAELGLDAKALASDKGVATLAGNALANGSEPLAMAYAGQQFGNWVPQLGDGRAVLLGEVKDFSGYRFDVQLKGSGPTPFSRMGDGRAWVGPVMREYIVSEAMAALGVPTTRALAAVATGEKVVREAVLPGAVLTRVSKGLIRVGTFQYFAARSDIDALNELTMYCLERLYPARADETNKPLALLEEVMAGQAQLVAKWMNLGFIHGVMNTDNVSIAGETIDYGPCAFMDDFHPNRVFSSIDEMGRYSYSNQPRIAHWNMVQFAQALLPILADGEEEAVKLAQSVVNSFPDQYMQAYQKGMNAKLGLASLQEGDATLGNDLLKLMSEQKADFTLAFRRLAEGEEAFLKEFDDPQAAHPWLEQWVSRREMEDTTKAGRIELMRSHNPAFIPRNHRIEQAIHAALESDFKPFHRLNRVLESPYDDQPGELDLMQSPQPKEVVKYTFCGT